MKPEGGGGATWPVARWNQFQAKEVERMCGAGLAGTVKLEHVALNVADPVAVAAWYGAHLGMRVVRHIPVPAQTHFLHDGGGSVVEIYRNPPDQVPDYAAMDPLIVHLAFTSKDAVADRVRLEAVGATFVTEVLPPDGSRLVMLRDPWGLALQICQRATPLVAG